MLESYLALGGKTWDDPRMELINTVRALRNVEFWNRQTVLGNLDRPCINWLRDCNACMGAERYLNKQEYPNQQDFHQRPGYGGVPVAPAAPWYDPQVPWSEKFMGVIGMEVQNAEGSSHTATVLNTISGLGSVGRARNRPRELLVRAILVAVDDEGLQYGIDWLTNASHGLDACEGDDIWFLDTCPTGVDDSEYPAFTSPPTSVPDPTPLLDPWVRTFQRARIIQGPTVTRTEHMSGGGSLAEVEMLIVAADPSKYAPPQTIFSGALTSRAGTMNLSPEPIQTGLPSTVYEYEVTATEDFDDVQVRLLDGTTEIDGFDLAHITAGQTILVSSKERLAPTGTSDMSGVPAPRWRVFDHEQATAMTVDYTDAGQAPTSLRVIVKADDRAAA